MVNIQTDQEASVLIVDDAGIVNETVRRTLERAGFFVRSVRDPREAFPRLREEPAHAVLLDLRMPALTGLDLMRLLRDTWPDTEIVIMTAYPDDAMVRQVMELGAAAIMTKPFPSLGEVRREAARAVLRSRLRQGLDGDRECLLRIALVEEGKVDPEEFERAAGRSRRGDLSLDLALAEAGFDSSLLELAVLEFLGVPRISLTNRPPDLNLIKRVPLALSRRLGVLPVALENGAILAATENPFSESNRQALEEVAGLPVVLGKADPEEIDAFLSALERELLRSRLPFAELLSRHRNGDVSDLELLSVAILTGEGEFKVESSEVSEGAPGAMRFSFKGVLTFKGDQVEAKPS